jgi:hypothetical protein
VLFLLLLRKQAVLENDLEDAILHGHQWQSVQVFSEIIYVGFKALDLLVSDQESNEMAMEAR